MSASGALLEAALGPHHSDPTHSPSPALAVLAEAMARRLEASPQALETTPHVVAILRAYANLSGPPTPVTQPAASSPIEPSSIESVDSLSIEPSIEPAASSVESTSGHPIPSLEAVEQDPLPAPMLSTPPTSPPPQEGINLPTAMAVIVVVPTLLVVLTMLAALIGKSSPPSHTQLRSFLDSWASAWSSRELARYQAFYAPEFQGSAEAGGKSLGFKEWMDRKAWVMANNHRIAVQAHEPTIMSEGLDRVVLTFDQDYASDEFASSVEKRLTLTRAQGTWKIAREETIGAERVTANPRP